MARLNVTAATRPHGVSGFSRWAARRPVLSTDAIVTVMRISTVANGNETIHPKTRRAGANSPAQVMPTVARSDQR